MEGSRDVGAQLFCTMLRAAGAECRLVCSLQPLPFAITAKTSTPVKPKRVDFVPYSETRAGISGDESSGSAVLEAFSSAGESETAIGKLQRIKSKLAARPGRGTDAVSEAARYIPSMKPIPKSNSKLGTEVVLRVV